MNGKRKLIAIFAVIVALAISGLAIAYWTQGGIGNGSATAGTTSAITVNQTGTPTGLYPGMTPVTLSGTFDNPNVHPVTISAVTAVVRAFNVPGVGGKPACTQNDFAIGGNFTGPYAVPVGLGAGAWTGLTVAMIDNGLNQDACKGVSITIDYTAVP